MKKYIMNNWRKILIVLGVILILYSIGMKFASESSLLDEYVANGKDVQSDIVDKIDPITGVIETPEGIDKNSDMYRLVFFLGAAIIVILVISAIAEGGGAPAKKKK